jgi:flagellar hook assembly protein FlgD
VIFDLGAPAARNVMLTVYDINGRLVKRWRATAGRRGQVAWDGSASNGLRAVRGVYFVRVEERGGSGRAAKVVVAR